MFVFQTGSAPYCIDIDGAGVPAADQLSLPNSSGPLNVMCAAFPSHLPLSNKRIILVLAGKSISQLAGFEPTRAEPIGFQVQRLNHSAIAASFFMASANVGLYLLYPHKNWNVFPYSSLRVGFEPTREDPIWFRVKRLNHSAIAAW